MKEFLCILSSFFFSLQMYNLFLMEIGYKIGVKNLLTNVCWKQRFRLTIFTSDLNLPRIFHNIL